MKRKLATVQKIETLSPIPGADFIEEVTLENLGWHMVTRKGTFKIGDPCVFFEVDSVLPDEPWADFMRDKKFRIKTIRLRGVLSQGLVLPFSDFSKEQQEHLFALSVWDDATEILGIQKYEYPASIGCGNASEQAGGYPRALLPKTDEIRVQSYPDVLQEIKGKPWYATVKCDGASATFVRLSDPFGSFQEGDLMVCTRNSTLRESPRDLMSTKRYKENAFFSVARKYDIASRLPKGMAIQGELVGPGIQKNRMKLESGDLYIFNVWDGTIQRYLDFPDACAFCEEHGFKMVPLVGTCTEDVFHFEDNRPNINVEYTLDWFLNFAEGKYPGTKTHREGIVIRPLREAHSKVLRGRLSFKVLNNSYLLTVES